jgi:nucleotide-binding universal stress UspA family protein
VGPECEGNDVFKKIVVPVDLVRLEQLDRALCAAADLARQYGASLGYIGVTPATPSEIAHTPEEYARKLAAFASGQAETHGIRAEALAYVSHDPAIDMTRTLLDAVAESGADLVVMASHIPNLADHLWPSHGGTIASRAGVSVFIVRPAA